MSSQQQLKLRFPLKATELRKWKRFAERGGVGTATAVVDKVAASPEDLMFLKGDQITCLAQQISVVSPELSLGYCEGVIGVFVNHEVEFSSNLKQAVFVKRSPAKDIAPPLPSLHQRTTAVNQVDPAVRSSETSLVDLYRYSRQGVRTASVHINEPLETEVINFSALQDTSCVPDQQERAPSFSIDAGFAASQLRKKAEATQLSVPLVQQTKLYELKEKPPGFSEHRPLIKPPLIRLPSAQGHRPCSESADSTPALAESSSESAASFESWVLRFQSGMLSPLQSASITVGAKSVPHSPSLPSSNLRETNNALQSQSIPMARSTAKNVVSAQLPNLHSGGLEFAAVRYAPEISDSEDESPSAHEIVQRGTLENRERYRRSFLPELQLANTIENNVDLFRENHFGGRAEVVQEALIRQSGQHQCATQQEQEARWLRILSRYTLPQALKYHAKTLKALVRLGLPKSLRSRCWSWLLHVDVVKEPEAYSRICMEENSQCPHYTTIVAHLEHCYAREPVFQMEKVPSKTDLCDLLCCFSRYRPTAMSLAHIFLARLILLYSPPEEAFWQLVALSDRTRSLFSTQESKAYNTTVEYLLEETEPQLASLFKRQEVPSHRYAPRLCQTLLSAVLPTETAIRFLDCFLLEGDVCLFRGVLAYFDLTRDALLNAHSSSIRRMIAFPDLAQLTPVCFFPTVFTLKLKEAQIRRLLKSDRPA